MGRARVLADGPRRTLLVDGLEAAVVDLADPARLEMPYMRRIAAVLEVLAPPGEPLDAVHLGAGGGALARHLAAVRPGSRSVAFEVDPDVVAVARAELALDAVPGLRVHTGDARAGLSGLRPRSADVVIADVFVGPRVPAHLETAGLVEQAARVLRRGGVYVANLIDEAPLRRVRRQVATIASVLGETALAADRAVLRGRRAGNLVVAAGRTLPAARLTRLMPDADVLDGEAVAVWCEDARPLRDG